MGRELKNDEKTKELIRLNGILEDDFKEYMNLPNENLKFYNHSAGLTIDSQGLKNLRPKRKPQIRNGRRSADALHEIIRLSITKKS